MAKQPVKKYIRIGVVGSRTYPNLGLVGTVVAKFGPCVVVSGGARGVDRMAAKTAIMLGYPDPIVLTPNWQKYGRKRAGFVRNTKIVKMSDGLIVFWDGKSPGTKDTLDKARKEKKPIILITPQGHSAENWDESELPDLGC